MNLAELMNKHPNKKYKRNFWNLQSYIEYDKNNYKWTTSENRDYNEVIGRCFMHDDWELYKKPINITKADIGKRVRLEEGSEGIIFAFIEDSNYPVFVGLSNGLRYTYSIDGVYTASVNLAEFNIIEILG